jgi:hypothetical protein
MPNELCNAVLGLLKMLINVAAAIVGGLPPARELVPERGERLY